MSKWMGLDDFISLFFFRTGKHTHADPGIFQMYFHEIRNTPECSVHLEKGISFREQFLV